MPDTVIERLLSSVRRHGHVDVAYVTEYASDVVTIRALAGDAAAVGIAVGDRVDADQALCLASVSGQLPPVIEDTSQVRVAQRLLASAGYHVGAFATVPIHLSDGTLYGALCVAHHAPLDDMGAPTELFLTAISDVIADQLVQVAAAEEDVAREREEVRALLEHGHMATLLQPIVALDDGRTDGVEALTRFTVQPRRPPDLWFSMAARHGLAGDLEVAAIERAVNLLDRVPSWWYVSVNVSPAVLSTGRLADVVTDEIAPRLVIEVTEHAAVQDYDGLTDAVDVLRGRGARIAVDDVGAGFSSFRHVLELRPDLIKIDRSLVRGLDVDPMHRAMVDSIVGFADRAEVGVVAEAVETPDELRVLQDLGVPAAQGYLFAAPCDPEDLRADYPVVVPVQRDAVG